MKRFRIIVDAGFTGAQHEEEVRFTDEEWAALSGADRKAALEEACETAISNHIEAYAEEIK